MSTRGQEVPIRIVEIRSLAARALEPLLEEESARWLALLKWDFAASAELVLRYAAMQALEGFALISGGEVAGYVYWVSEEQKGLIGDLYLRDAFRSPTNENLLLGAALGQLRRCPWIRRVEAQLMHLVSRGSQVAAAGLRPVTHARHFMLARLERPMAMRAFALPGLRFEPWSPRRLDEAAGLIAEVYADHVDAQINDQYNSPEGARRFLQNIVQYPGCGHFAPLASYLMLDESGRAQGLSLASHVARETGHIAQIGVSKTYQGTGAAYELLRRSMVALAEAGARDVSLTVTASNARAIKLYERFGFTAIHHFEALVWRSLWP